MFDNLDAILDAFERPGTVQYSAVPHSAVPLEQAPEPEPAESWHAEPVTGEPKSYPVTITRVETPAPEIVYKPDAPKPARKTPDEMSWRECWLRIGKLYTRGYMDAGQYHDLCAAAEPYRVTGIGAPPASLLDLVRSAVWQFESVDEERGSERARRAPRDRRVNP